MERGMNERIRRLRRESLETEAHIDMERAKIETEVYRRYEGTVSVPELRALVLKHYFAEKTLYIGEGELLVGEKGNGPQAAPTFPELCCHTVQDLHVMNDRELISFKVREEDYGFQEKEMIPFWSGRKPIDVVFLLNLWNREVRGIPWVPKTFISGGFWTIRRRYGKRLDIWTTAGTRRRWIKRMSFVPWILLVMR